MDGTIMFLLFVLMNANMRDLDMSTELYSVYATSTIENMYSKLALFFI